MSKRVSQLPPTIGIKDPETRQFLDTLTNILDHRSGNTDKHSPDRFVTAAELVDVMGGAGAYGASGGSSTGLPSTGGGYSISDIVDKLSGAIQNTALYDILGQNITLLQDKYSAEIAALQAELSAASNQILGLKDGSTDIVIKTDAGTTSIRALKDSVYDPITGLPAAQAAIGQINNVKVTSTSAAARQIASVVAQVNDPTSGLPAANANITAINDVSTTSKSANARQLAGVSAAVYDEATGLAKAWASITALNDVSATSTSASARYLFAVNASVGQKNKIFFQGVAPASTASYTLREADIWFDSSNKNKMYRWTGSAWVESSDQRIAEASALVVTEQDTRVNKDNALAQAINTVWSAIGGSSALIQDSALAQVSPAAVQATKWTQVQAAVTDPNTGNVSSTSIKQDLTSYANKVDGTLNATYSVRAQITSNGQAIVGGFGLTATDGAGSAAGPTIDFGVRADTFWVGGLDATKKIPFIIRTASSALPDGTVVPAGVYIDTAMVDRLYGTYINAGLLDAAKIYTGSQYIDRSSNQEISVVASSSYSISYVDLMPSTTVWVPGSTGYSQGEPYTIPGYFQTVISGDRIALVGSLSPSLRFYGPGNHSGVPRRQRCRLATVDRPVVFSVSASATVDHYLSIWYRKNGSGSWSCLAYVAEPQADDGSAAVAASVELSIGVSDYVEFTAAPVDPGYNPVNINKTYLKALTISVTAVNL